MSRFIEVLNQYRKDINFHNLPKILEELKKRLNATSAHMEIGFPYFIEKESPVSGAISLMDYNCRLLADSTDKTEIKVEVEVPITLLCPCSKEISQKGAHNQRGWVKVLVLARRFFWIEDLISLIEDSASAPLFSLLKRQDEKYVTEMAYENPMFVEDVARTVTEKLSKDPCFLWFRVESEGWESIHNHNSYALIEKGDAGKE